MANKVVSVQGLQWGSEAKGSIASMIAHAWKPDTVASAWHPNAGHTAYIYGAGEKYPTKFVHSMLPLGALAPSVHTILLGPGSVIDFDKLVQEIAAAKSLLQDKTLVVHPAAAILQPCDKTGEEKLVKIGSTMKGSAHATVRKMMRGTWAEGPSICGEAYDLIAEDLEPVHKVMDFQLNEQLYDYHIDASKRLLLEGAQGYGLGIHNSGFYPYTTSRDVSTAQLLADCRVPFQPVTTVGVCRTFPIRVANRFQNGTQVGTSGPAYPAQRELDWQMDLGREPELTTVTRLPRRIFEFSMQQIQDACRVMQPTYIALTFCDYLGDLQRSRNGAIGHWLPPRAVERVQEIEYHVGTQVGFVTTSPTEVWQLIDSNTGFMAPIEGLDL